MISNCPICKSQLLANSPKLVVNDLVIEYNCSNYNGNITLNNDCCLFRVTVNSFDNIIKLSFSYKLHCKKYHYYSNCFKDSQSFLQYVSLSSFKELAYTEDAFIKDYLQDIDLYNFEPEKIINKVLMYSVFL